jgi:hypothetical protein
MYAISISSMQRYFDQTSSLFPSRRGTRYVGPSDSMAITAEAVSGQHAGRIIEPGSNTM